MRLRPFSLGWHTTWNGLGAYDPPLSLSPSPPKCSADWLQLGRFIQSWLDFLFGLFWVRFARVWWFLWCGVSLWDSQPNPAIRRLWWHQGGAYGDTLPAFGSCCWGCWDLKWVSAESSPPTSCCGGSLYDMMSPLVTHIRPTTWPFHSLRGNKKLVVFGNTSPALLRCSRGFWSQTSRVWNVNNTKMMWTFLVFKSRGLCIISLLHYNLNSMANFARRLICP